MPIIYNIYPTFRNVVLEANLLLSVRITTLLLISFIVSSEESSSTSI